MKKIISVLLTGMLCTGLLAGCGASAGEDTSANKNTNSTAGKAADEQSVNASSEGAFVLEYPEDMQSLGFTEPVVLDQVPQRIVSLSTSPVLALYEMNANIVGVTDSVVVAWPEDLMEETSTVTFSAMDNGEYDFESIVALEPDLIFLASAAKDTAGAALETLGLNVYYVYAGHTVSYDSVKSQTQAIVDAFSVDEESTAAGEAIMARFDELEEKITSAKDAFSGLNVLVLQSGSETAHYAQTKDGTLGSMLDKIGFHNVYENSTTSMALLDYEQALSYAPDYIVCVGSANADTQQQMMEKAFEINSEYWGAMPAVQNKNVVYVDSSYVASAGIHVIDCITELIDIMSEATGIHVE